MDWAFKAFAVIGASVALVIGAAGAASANVCDSGAFCAYQKVGYDSSGIHYEWQGGSDVWPSGIFNAENSVRNYGTSGLVVQVYDYSWGINEHYCVFKGHSLNLPDANDEDGQSHYWESATGKMCF